MNMSINEMTETVGHPFLELDKPIKPILTTELKDAAPTLGHPSKALLSTTTNSSYPSISTNYPSCSSEDSDFSRVSVDQKAKKAELSNSLPSAPSVAVKLFVNRIPKWMCNDKLKETFSAFGSVLECNILKDSSGHKGCAFVKYSSISEAHEAIVKLHGKMVLSEESGPVQIKYANGEIDRLGLSADVQPGGESVKVFVGCLSKNFTEEELFSLFSRFGRVDEVFVIRDSNKKPKCSAFVTFPKMAMALAAIRSLDMQYTPASCHRPIEVRLAESRGSKQKVRASQQQSGAEHSHSVEGYGSNRRDCNAVPVYNGSSYTYHTNPLCGNRGKLMNGLGHTPVYPALHYDHNAFGDCLKYCPQDNWSMHYDTQMQPKLWETPIDFNRTLRTRSNPCLMLNNVDILSSSMSEYQNHFPLHESLQNGFPQIEFDKIMKDQQDYDRYVSLCSGYDKSYQRRTIDGATALRLREYAIRQDTEWNLSGMDNMGRCEENMY